MKTLTVVLVLALLATGCPVADETIMPTGAVTSGGTSWAESDNYAIQFSVGQPCIGVGTSANAQADAGFWYLLWVEEATAGWMNLGWNWISIPTHPQFPQVWVIFDDDPENRLFGWEWLDKYFLLYPDDFEEMELALGYTLYAYTDEAARYSGFLARTPLDDPQDPEYRSLVLQVPAMGWIWVGHPYPWPVDIATLKVRYGQEIRSVWEDIDAVDPWINWSWIYWDPYQETAGICSPEGGDDEWLRPWNHYRVYCYMPQTPGDPDGPFIIIPEPEFSFGP